MERSELEPMELDEFDRIMDRFKIMGYNDINVQQLALLVHNLNGCIVIIEDAFDVLAKLLSNTIDSVSVSLKPLIEEIGDEDAIYKSYWWFDNTLRPALNVSRNYFIHQDFINRSDSKRRNLARRML